jgi:hypothetical protein
MTDWDFNLIVDAFTQIEMHDYRVESVHMHSSTFKKLQDLDRKRKNSHRGAGYSINFDSHTSIYDIWSATVIVDDNMPQHHVTVYRDPVAPAYHNVILSYTKCISKDCDECMIKEVLEK